MSRHRFATLDVEEYARVDTDLCDLAHVTGMGPESRYRIRLGLHELLVNIRDHSYDSGGGPVQVVIGVTSARLRIVVTDWGRPLAGPIHRELPERPAAGGYGLPIIGEAFDRVTYRRVSGLNVWRLEWWERAGEVAS